MSDINDPVFESKMAQYWQDADTMQKEAVSRDTEAFVKWVLHTQRAMGENAAARFIEKNTGREPSQPKDRPPSRRGPLTEGETVLVNKYKNTNSMNVDAAEEYHNRVGVVDRVGSDGLTIAFYRGDAERPSKDLSGEKQFFEGTASGKSTGLYRWTPKPDYMSGAGSRAMVEAVYIRANQTVDRRSVEQIEQYVDRGEAIGQSRSRVYYSGVIAAFAIGKDGSMYFGVAAQQRDRPTSMNPSKGELLYLGLLGRRPSGWKAEAQELGFFD